MREGELDFEIPEASVTRLDEQSVPMPHGMQLVDFVIEEPNRTLLIEVKDPSHSGTPDSELIRYARRMTGNALADQELVPKARDSYSHIHLMRRDSKAFTYVVVLGLERVPVDRSLLLVIKERVLKRIRQEGRVPWRRKYVRDVIIISTADWSKHFPRYPLTRIP